MKPPAVTAWSPTVTPRGNSGVRLYRVLWATGTDAVVGQAVGRYTFLFESHICRMFNNGPSVMRPTMPVKCQGRLRVVWALYTLCLEKNKTLNSCP